MQCQRDKLLCFCSRCATCCSSPRSQIHTTERHTIPGAPQQGWAVKGLPRPTSVGYELNWKLFFGRGGCLSLVTPHRRDGFGCATLTSSITVENMSCHAAETQAAFFIIITIIII